MRMRKGHSISNDHSQYKKGKKEAWQPETINQSVIG